MSSGETSSHVLGSPRRLAAVLCADIAGYSRLMGIDEEGTHARVKRHRREIIEPTIAEHSGRIIKNTGDGFLAMFDSPLEAVRCAIVIQQSMAGRNMSLPKQQWVQYRIGVNLGDVIVDPEDIYGDGVNIAARLEHLAEPGSVYISGGVYEQIKNKLVCGYQSLGDEKLKNITDPVRIYRVLPDPAAVARAERMKRLRVGLVALVALVVVGTGAGGWFAWQATTRPASKDVLAAGTAQSSQSSPVAQVPSAETATSASPAATPSPTLTTAAAPTAAAVPASPVAPSQPALPAPEPSAAPTAAAPAAPVSSIAPTPPAPAAPTPSATTAAIMPPAIPAAPDMPDEAPALAPPPRSAAAVAPTAPARSSLPSELQGSDALPGLPPAPAIVSEAPVPVLPQAAAQAPPAPVAQPQPAPPPAAPTRVAAIPVQRMPERPPATKPVFRDCPTCPEMVNISGGTFMMGSNDDPSEKPIHQVTVAPFALGRFPVTIGEWKECVAAKACSYDPDGDPDLPVHNVSWADAQQYVRWLSGVTRQDYRLPTEAEWEHAARAGATSKYWWGSHLVAGMADCKGCGGTYDPHAPLKVGSFPPNAFGLHGMAGGVAQWVSDCWAKDYQGAPRDGSSRNLPNCRERVLRGGSWMHDPSYVTVSSRGNYDASVRYTAHGLRVARSAKQGG
jgi:formylglycine-generating enzyme required for sulfatase activity/class 3 adenylate cyclase